MRTSLRRTGARDCTAVRTMVRAPSPAQVPRVFDRQSVDRICQFEDLLGQVEQLLVLLLFELDGFHS